MEGKLFWLVPEAWGFEREPLSVTDAVTKSEGPPDIRVDNDVPVDSNVHEEEILAVWLVVVTVEFKLTIELGDNRDIVPRETLVLLVVEEVVDVVVLVVVVVVVFDLLVLTNDDVTNGLVDTEDSDAVIDGAIMTDAGEKLVINEEAAKVESPLDEEAEMTGVLIMTLEPNLTGRDPTKTPPGVFGAMMRNLCTPPAEDLEAAINWMFWVDSSDLTDPVWKIGAGVASGSSVLIITPGGRGYFFSSRRRLAARFSGDKDFSVLGFLWGRRLLLAASLVRGLVNAEVPSVAIRAVDPVALQPGTMIRKHLAFDEDEELDAKIWTAAEELATVTTAWVTAAAVVDLEADISDAKVWLCLAAEVTADDVADADLEITDAEVVADETVDGNEVKKFVIGCMIDETLPEVALGVAHEAADMLVVAVVTEDVFDVWALMFIIRLVEEEIEVVIGSADGSRWIVDDGDLPGKVTLTGRLGTAKAAAAGVKLFVVTGSWDKSGGLMGKAPPLGWYNM